MKLDLIEKIEIPEGIEVAINHADIKVSGNGKENTKKFNLENIDSKIEGKEIVLSVKKATKRELKRIKTIRAHVENMIKGVGENFVYKLEIAFVHFPMTVEVKGNDIVIKNFLGEKKDRGLKILEGTDVTVDGKLVTVQSHNKELAGQMAANIEKATRVTGKDRRKFQDGIYITEKPGRVI